MFKFLRETLADGIYYVVRKNVIASWLNRDKDPIKYCEVYTKEGCEYINGPLCDMYTCSLRKCNSAD